MKETFSAIDSAIDIMSGAITTVRIALSDQGIQKYKRLLHLRPNYVSISDDGHVYTFNCSLNQIEFYFFTCTACRKYTLMFRLLPFFHLAPIDITINIIG